jgi:virginiamycin B lyase
MARRTIHVTIAAALLAAGCSTGDAGSSPPALITSAATTSSTLDTQPRLETFALPAGAGPHDVAPAADGGIWFTAQHAGYLGHLDPATRAVTQVGLGQGSQPHGVIVGADGAAWVTDGGTNAIVRVDGTSRAVRSFPLPADRPDANLNTAAFDGQGVLWFTGQNGIYGRLDPRTGDLAVYPAPRGRGPYGITATPAGEVYYASLAGNHIARIDTTTGAATPIDPPTGGQGARRVWSDSRGLIWVSEYNAGQVARFDPATGQWKEWKLPGGGPQTYAVYVDNQDRVWASDFGSNSIVGFDPRTERFTTVALPTGAGSARQLLGRPGQIWGATSGKDTLFVIHTG